MVRLAAGISRVSSTVSSRLMLTVICASELSTSDTPSGRYVLISTVVSTLVVTVDRSMTSAGMTMDVTVFITSGAPIILMLLGLTDTDSSVRSPGS